MIVLITGKDKLQNMVLAEAISNEIDCRSGPYYSHVATFEDMYLGGGIINFFGRLLDKIFGDRESKSQKRDRYIGILSEIPKDEIVVFSDYGENVKSLAGDYIPKDKMVIFVDDANYPKRCDLNLYDIDEFVAYDDNTSVEAYVSDLVDIILRGCNDG